MFFLSLLNKVYLQLEHRTYWKSTLWTLHYAPFKVSLLEGVISLESSEMFLNRYEPNAERVSKLSLPLYLVLQKNKSREVFYILERCPWSLNAWVLKQYQGFYPKTDILQLPYRRSQPLSFAAVERYHHNLCKHHVLWHVTSNAHSRLSLSAWEPSKNCPWM